MVILALDTTTRASSAALARGDRMIEEAASDPAQPTAARLPADLIALLDRHGVALAAVDVFAVATGPGSFTGLRIGIATMQGLAFANRRPLIGVSAFDALAELTTAPGAPSIATWVDAWRGEVYAAFYEERREAMAPTVDTPESVLTALGARLAGNDPVHVRFVGDGAATYRDVIAQQLGPGASVAETPLLAGAIAQLAGRAAARGERPLPHAIRPLYIRRPDAELARSRARGLEHHA